MNILPIKMPSLLCCVWASQDWVKTLNIFVPGSCAQRIAFLLKLVLSLSNDMYLSSVWVEKAMAPHSRTLAWKIPWTEEPGRLQSMGLRRVNMTEWLHFHFSVSCIGEGNGNPLQCSCLENPRDRGAWWAAVYGVAQSQTRLKRPSSSSSVWIPTVSCY